MVLIARMPGRGKSRGRPRGRFERIRTFSGIIRWPRVMARLGIGDVDGDPWRMAGCRGCLHVSMGLNAWRHRTGHVSRVPGRSPAAPVPFTPRIHGGTLKPDQASRGRSPFRNRGRPACFRNQEPPALHAHPRPCLRHRTGPAAPGMPASAAQAARGALGALWVAGGG